MAVSVDGTTTQAADNGQQRRMVEMSNGQLWFGTVVSNTLSFHYSNDNGSTWTKDTGATHSTNVADNRVVMFVDWEDKIYAAYSWNNASDYYGNVLVGTVSGNAITWVEDQHVTNNETQDVSIFQIKAWQEGSGTRIFVSSKSGSNQATLTRRTLTGTTWGTMIEHVVGSAPSGLISFDFEHTGDGKTATSTPHVYVCYGQSGGGAGDDDFYFRKLSWSAGPSWNWGTRTTLSTSSGCRANGREDLKFDGTRCVMMAENSSGNPLVYERDAADTTTTSRLPTSTGILSGQSGQLVIDPTTQDIYLLSYNSTSQPVYTKYDRVAGLWDSAATVIEAEAAYNSGMLGWCESTTQVHAYWHTNTGTYARTELALSYNSDPTAPELENPSDGASKDVNAGLYVQWVFHDPDSGDTQGAYSLRRQIGTASYSYWTGAAWTASESASTKISTATTELTLASGWGSDGDDSHYYAVKTWDAADAGPSPWSLESEVIPSAKDNPTVTAITTVTAPTYNVTWTVATQTRYRVRVYDDSGGSPVTSTVFYDSGQQWSAVTSHSTPFPDNNVTRHVGVVTWNDEALMSDEDTEQLAVSYPVPPTPTVSMSTTGSESGVIWVSINNPTPGGGETVTDSNEVYRRVAAEGGNGIRVAQGVAEDGGFNDYGPLSEVVYQYRARAINAGLGTAAYGAWTT